MSPYNKPTSPSDTHATQAVSFVGGKWSLIVERLQKKLKEDEWLDGWMKLVEVGNLGLVVVIGVGRLQDGCQK